MGLIAGNAVILCDFPQLADVFQILTAGKRRIVVQKRLDSQWTFAISNMEKSKWSKPAFATSSMAFA